MIYRLSDRSKSRLIGVHPDLVAVTYRALDISQIDFGVAGGIRTIEQQRRFVQDGKSQTMDSKHLPQKLRLPGAPKAGCAVDLFAFIRGKARWEVNALFMVADAMLLAAKEYNIELIWGGAWGRKLTDYDYAVQAYEEYVQERKKPFIDAPHFELVEF